MKKLSNNKKIEKSNQVKSIRNQYMSDTLARCDRYEKQMIYEDWKATI